MDLATIIGIFAGFGLVVSAILLGPKPGGFIDIPSLMIVLGGSLSSVLIAFPLEQVVAAFKAVSKTLFTKKTSPKEVIETMVKVAEISRREGLLALERLQTDNPLLKKATQLIADSAEPALINDTLAIEISAMKKRHMINISVMQALGGACPALGMVGTLVGLVQMLANLSDAAAIGPAMAVALITTFYGSLFANLLFNPFAAKLKARSTQEELTLHIIFEGARSILDNNNPRFVYEKLSSYLPQSQRSTGDKGKK